MDQRLTIPIAISTVSLAIRIILRFVSAVQNRYLLWEQTWKGMLSTVNLQRETLVHLKIMK